MLDESKEENYFKERTDFKDSYHVKYLKYLNRTLKESQKAEANLEPNPPSTMELFCKYT